MIKQRRFRAVLFDLDDTLISWEHADEGWELFKRSRAAGLRAYLQVEGHSVPDLSEFNGIVEQVIAELWTEVKADFSAARIDEGLMRIAEMIGVTRSALRADELLRAYGWGPIPATRPHEDAQRTLQSLDSQGYRLGLVTNAMQPMWMRDIELEWHGLISHFPIRLSSYDAGHMKPHPSIFLQALAGLGVDAEQAVFVGDRPANDIAGANAVGMVSVLMRPGYLEGRHDLDALPPEQVPDHIISHLGEMLSLMQRLESAESAMSIPSPTRHMIEQPMESGDG